MRGVAVKRECGPLGPASSSRQGAAGPVDRNQGGKGFHRELLGRRTRAAAAPAT
jgi:hypothetical protein